MYSVRLGYKAAIERIEKLMRNRHYAESLVTSVFTVEKTIRRTLKQLIVSAGFENKFADKIIKQTGGFDRLKEAWEFYDPYHRKLTDVVSQTDFQIIQEAIKKRNRLIHGLQVYNLNSCRNETINVLAALDRIKTKFDKLYGYSGWTNISIRKKSKLHTDPKVKTK